MDDYLRSLNFIKWATGAAPKILFLGVRLVPEAEVNTGILNGSYRESCCSDLIAKQAIKCLTRISIFRLKQLNTPSFSLVAVLIS